MYTLNIKKSSHSGLSEPMENIVTLKNWNDVYNFSLLFRDSLKFGWEGANVESYVYLNLSVELTIALLSNHGGWMPKSTIDEQLFFFQCRFSNIFRVKYPWFSELEHQEYELIRYSKDRTKIEWLDKQICDIILNEFENLYWLLYGKAKDTFFESEVIFTKQELQDHIKSVYAIP
jgi:hypothetical protein